MNGDPKHTLIVAIDGMGILTNEERKLFEDPDAVERTVCRASEHQQLLHDESMSVSIQEHERTVRISGKALFARTSELSIAQWTFGIRKGGSLPSTSDIKSAILRLAKHGVVVSSKREADYLEVVLGLVFAEQSYKLEYRFIYEDNNVYLIGGMRSPVIQNIRNDKDIVSKVVDRINRKIDILREYDVQEEELVYEIMTERYEGIRDSVIDVDAGTLEIQFYGTKYDTTVKIDAHNRSIVACIKKFFKDIFYKSLTVKDENSLAGVLEKFRTAPDMNITRAFHTHAKAIVKKARAEDIHALTQVEPFWMGHLLHWAR